MVRCGQYGRQSWKPHVRNPRHGVFGNFGDAAGSDRFAAIVRLE
jgi:hypothetical protein